MKTTRFGTGGLLLQLQVGLVIPAKLIPVLELIRKALSGDGKQQLDRGGLKSLTNCPLPVPASEAYIISENTHRLIQRPISASLNQKSNRNPNCIARGWLACAVTRPNSGLPTWLPGAANLGWLNVL